MDKYELARLCKKAAPVSKAAFIQEICRGKKVLDMGCIRHNATFSESDPNWLHQKIIDVAAKVVGVDFLQGEVDKLKHKYDIRYGDITKPLDIEGSFDVIVAGDVIEHLANFDGMFENCLKLLKDDGVLLISTGNPFYTDTFHFVAFKGRFLSNPEHTCWIDPQTLLQLVSRYQLEVKDVRFLKQCWYLSNHILEREGFDYDILNDRWSKNTFVTRSLRRYVGFLFQCLYYPYKLLTLNNTKMVKYSDYIAVIHKTKS